MVQLSRMRILGIILAMWIASHAAQAAELLTPGELDAWLAKHPDAQLVDVRTPREFATGHIAGARLLNWGERDFKDRARAELDPKRPVLLICRSGRRSAAAAKTMKTLGFTTMADLRGGMIAWRKADRPVQRSTP